jgi:hypothetical protein
LYSLLLNSSSSVLCNFNCPGDEMDLVCSTADNTTTQHAEKEHVMHILFRFWFMVGGPAC